MPTLPLCHLAAAAACGRYDYLGDDVAPGRFRRRAAGQARDHRRGLGGRHRRGRGGQAEGGHRQARRAAAARDLAPLRRLGRSLYPGAAGRGAAHGHERAVGARAAADDRGLAAAAGVGEMPAPGQAAAKADTPRAGACCAVLAGGPARRTSELAREAGVGTGVVKAMAAAGLLEAVSCRRCPPFARPDGIPRGPGPVAGAAARRPRRWSRQSGRWLRVTLLDGVTGSGKTEVYFEAVAAALRAGQQALVLLPEIALTGQWLERFEQRFGARPAEWHSDLTGAERRAAWRAIADGRGPGRGRRALGAVPAVPRSRPDRRRRGARQLLQAGGRRHLPRARHGGGAGPSRPHPGACWPRPRRRWRPLQNVAGGPLSARCICRTAMAARRCPRSGPSISGAIRRRASAGSRRRLVAALEETLAAGEQALLFLNRRGYAPLTLCRACGHRMNCPQLHRLAGRASLAGRLLCHHCGYQAPAARACPACGAADSFAACGPGVERLAEEAAALFPAARIALLTTDTLIGPRAAPTLIERIVRARDRHPDRHPDGGQGPSLSHADPGRRGRRRSRPERRRPARGRAHLPAPAPGRGPRRPRRAAGPGAAADLRCPSIR